MLVAAAAAMSGCYLSTPPAPPPNDAIIEVVDEVEPDGGVCRVRWVCICDKFGECSRLDGSACLPDDLRDPADDPCLRP